MQMFTFSNSLVELRCFRWDRSTLEKLGFIQQTAQERRPVINMVHRTAGCGIISMLLELGQNGIAFYGTSETPWFLFAADGKRSVVAQAMVACHEPITIVKEDGRLPGYRQAIEYYEVLATTKARMRAAEEGYLAR
jgi:hypothetical protein